jgi:serine/threonine-protein kinase
VTGQNPGANTFASKGATITLSVSKGPTTSGVPDVTSQDEETAVGILRESKFRVRTIRQDTTDPLQDGIVLSQDPEGGAQAEPGSTVTITVGRVVVTDESDDGQ